MDTNEVQHNEDFTVVEGPTQIITRAIIEATQATSSDLGDPGELSK